MKREDIIQWIERARHGNLTEGIAAARNFLFDAWEKSKSSLLISALAWIYVIYGGFDDKSPELEAIAAEEPDLGKILFEFYFAAGFFMDVVRTDKNYLPASQEFASRPGWRVVTDLALSHLVKKFQLENLVQNVESELFSFSVFQLMDKNLKDIPKKHRFNDSEIEFLLTAAINEYFETLPEEFFEE